MEIMRISESQELNIEEFLEGYYNGKIIEDTEKVIQSIYRLDTALMLSVLFTSFVNDSYKKDYFLNRVQVLSKDIQNNV